MPTTYTHYRFGQEVLKRLDIETARPILQYKELFDCGLHGPDILFYYHALKGNDIIRLGGTLHHLSGRAFFSDAAEVLKEASAQGPVLAYLYGFLCHFALDRRCHAYIDPFVEASGVSHFETEAELDRYYLLMDGRDPFREILTRHIVPRERNAAVIAKVLDHAAPLTKPENEIHVGTEEVLTAMKSFRLYLDILVCPTRFKRGALIKLLKMVGHADFSDLIIHTEPNPACDQSNEDLDQLYEAALDDAVMLIEDFLKTVQGKKEWDPFYFFDFEGLPAD